MSYPGEKIHSSERDIHYVLQESSKPYLIVVYSGFSPAGKPPLYNYVNTLSDVDCNKLFILDWGPRGCYYIGKDRDHSVERSVVDLIDTISVSKGISRQQVINCGSSKGGFAALYLTLKYGYGHAIVGSPQTLVGDYLLKQVVSASDVAEFISGGKSDSDLVYLNSLLFDVVESTNHKPDIHIHLGRGEYHYKQHVLPFNEWMDKRGIPYNLDLGDYDTHAEVAKHYPPFLKKHIRSIIGG